MSEPWKGELFSGFVDVTLSLRWWAAGGSTREIQKGDLVLAEITGTYNGYPGQLIRPIALVILRSHRFQTISAGL